MVDDEELDDDEDLDDDDNDEDIEDEKDIEDGNDEDIVEDDEIYDNVNNDNSDNIQKKGLKLDKDGYRLKERNGLQSENWRELRR